MQFVFSLKLAYRNEFLKVFFSETCSHIRISKDSMKNGDEPFFEFILFTRCMNAVALERVCI